MSGTTQGATSGCSCPHLWSPSPPQGSQAPRLQGPAAPSPRHPLAVRDKSGRAILDCRTVFGQTQSFHPSIPCGAAVLSQRGPGMSGENRMSMSVYFGNHMAQLHKKLHSFLAGILPKTFIFRLDF